MERLIKLYTITPLIADNKLPIRETEPKNWTSCVSKLIRFGIIHKFNIFSNIKEIAKEIYKSKYLSMTDLMLLMNIPSRETTMMSTKTNKYTMFNITHLRTKKAHKTPRIKTPLIKKEAVNVVTELYMFVKRDNKDEAELLKTERMARAIIKPKRVDEIKSKLVMELFIKPKKLAFSLSISLNKIEKQVFKEFRKRSPFRQSLEFRSELIKNGTKNITILSPIMVSIPSVNSNLVVMYFSRPGINEGNVNNKAKTSGRK